MDKLISDLLEIEQSATNSMHELELEHALGAKRTADEINRRTMEVIRMSGKSLQAYKLEVEENTQAQLDTIQDEYQEEAARLERLFKENGADWKKTWVSHILQ